MPSLMGTLNSATSGMAASQTAIQTTSHNITNLNTPGYTRQRVEQKAGSSYSSVSYNSNIGAGQLGTGVQITDITRIRNTFYDFQFRNESHSYGNISLKYDYYKNMENIFGEPSDNGISSSINNFFNGFNELSKDPNSTGIKSGVIENANYLANNINETYKKLDMLQQNLNKQSEDILSDINDKVSQLKALDKNIKIVQSSGKSPNDLLDEKDRILDELSYKLNINDSDVQKVLKKATDADKALTMEDFKDLIDNNKLSGELQAAVSINEKISEYKGQLENLAKAIADTVNEAYGKGEIFNFNKDKDELLCINDSIENNINNFEVTSDLALKIYKVKDMKVTFGEVPYQQEMTISGFYNSTIQQLGQESQTVIRQESNQSKLLENIDSSRISVSGVSIDEEMVNLIQFQHVYNASAKVVSTIDSLLDVVINGLIK